MAISIDWATSVINIPKADTQLVQSLPTEIRQLDLDAFRLELKALEESVYGMPNTKTHDHNPPVTVGGVTLARVVEILAPYTVTFEDGQYAVNLVGANSNVGDRTNVNQVSIRSANSAGLTFSEEINNQSFTNNRVYINTVGDGFTGTSFPNGTPNRPVDNFSDADAIADARSYRGFAIEGQLTFAPGDSTESHSYYGISPITDQLIFQGSDTTATTFERLAVIGALGGVGLHSFNECSFFTLSGFRGLAFNCAINDYVVLDTTSPDDISFLQCLSGVPGNNTPYIDFNGTTANVQIRNYTGGLELRNITQAIDVTVEALNINLIIDSSCTAGNISVKGRGLLTDNSNGTTVNSRAFIDTRSHRVNTNRAEIVSNQLIVYDDDGVTPLYTFNLQDGSGNASSTNIFKRIPI